MAEQTENKAAAGGFAPLKIPLFAVLWGATVLGNVGSFMRDVASSWLITDLSSNPSAVALMQTAATLPVFLLAIPAGVLSDILDRRRFLIFVQILLACVSGSLLVLSQTGSLTVEYLLALTFVGGIGAALMGPTWQAIVPELVPRAELKNAVALNSLGINIARSIGPAAGGLLLASFGAGAAYGADVMSYVLVIAALLWWKRPKVEDSGLSEHFFGAFRAGLRYARSSRELHVVLLRAAVFFAFSSSVWALLPLVARRMLGGSAGFYGVLLGAVGAGAILGAIVLPRLRQRLNADGLVLLVGGVGLLAAGLLFHRLRLPTGEADLQPSNHWPEPLVNTPVENDRGPVMIQVEYRIREQDRPQFLRTLLMLERARRRDGAYAWGITEHTGDPECIMEWFLVESWAEHLRQHQRVSHADADLQQEALRFHIGPEKPVVHHFLSLDRRQVKH
ncbi:MFS transporter [Serratia marcescens]|uniref:MFS transporter n=1 Tax=Serratia marcescens TaxID=615 RepID=UPI002760207F|nr:MFS transporter [Serratia marcescens]MDP8824724.1 MFS transporter [Serratia marcescens]